MNFRLELNPPKIPFRHLIDSLKEKDATTMPQVDFLLEKLQSGASAESLVRQEKKRRKKKLEQEQNKGKRLKLLQKNPGRPSDKKRKADDGVGLTGDEQIAVELYEAMRKKKRLEEDSESEEEEEREKPGQRGSTGNEANDDTVPEDGKRGITYQIAKNKVRAIIWPKIILVLVKFN